MLNIAHRSSRKSRFAGCVADGDGPQRPGAIPQRREIDDHIDVAGQVVEIPAQRQEHSLPRSFDKPGPGAGDAAAKGDPFAGCRNDQAGDQLAEIVRDRSPDRMVIADLSPTRCERWVSVPGISAIIVTLINPV